MVKKKAPAKNFWESAGIKIGVISGIIGIGLSIPSIISAFKPDTKSNLESKDIELKLREYEPLLEVSYIDVWGDIYQTARYSEEGNKNNKYYLDYTVAASEISITDTSSLHVKETDEFLLHTVYLMVQNRGKATATDIELDVNRCILNQPVKIIEKLAGVSDDYQQKIITGSGEQKTTTIKLPLNLETGKGILIPLMISGTNYSVEGPVSPNREWKIVSKIAYLPITIRYKNPLDEKAIEKKVRKMNYPVRLSEGVEIRG
jgi:hypothetical protein